jgi:hypothetical protein
MTPKPLAGRFRAFAGMVALLAGLFGLATEISHHHRLRPPYFISTSTGPFIIFWAHQGRNSSAMPDVGPTTPTNTATTPMLSMRPQNASLASDADISTMLRHQAAADRVGAWLIGIAGAIAISTRVRLLIRDWKK